jgi:hypothetical protein
VDLCPTRPEITPRWWHGPFSVFQSNLQEIDAGLDVESALDAIEDHGATAWLLNAGGIVSNYPTNLAFQTRNPYLSERASGDLIGDAIEAAQRREIKVLGRFDLSKVSVAIAEKHPEWCFRSHDGQPQVYHDLWSVCPSAGYYQERAFEIFDEVLTRYPLDGIFINWFNFNIVDYSRKRHGVCHCNACAEGFRKWSGGADLPVDLRSPDLSRWIGFTESVLSDLNRRLTDHIHSLSPDTLVVLGKRADMRYAEQGKMFGKELWPSSTSDEISELHNHEPPIRALINSVSFVDMPYRMAGEEPAHFAQYLYQGIARGGMPSTYIMGAPGRIPYASLDTAGKITRYFQRHKSMYADLAPAARLAVVKSSARPGSPGSDEHLGIYTILQRDGRPFDVLPKEQLTALHQAGRLVHYDAILLPDIGTLGAHASVLDAYVDQGGHLITTGSSAVAENDECELRGSPLLTRRSHVRSAEELWSSYATTTHQDQALRHTFHGLIAGIFGSAFDAAWTEDASSFGEMLPAAPYGPPEKAYGHMPSPEDPAYARRSSGNSGGSVTVFPWTVGTSYREVETSAAKTMLLGALDQVLPQRWSVDAPEQIEVIAGCSGDDLVVHLINLTGASRRGFRPPAPVSGVRVRLPEIAAGAKVEVLVAGSTGSVDAGGAFLVDVLGDAEVLVFQGVASVA